MANSPNNPFIKELASSDRRTRDNALTSLRTYLHRSTPFTDLDFLKLWKGLFFSMWMSDKPLTQQRLARDLADLLIVLQGEENFLGFVRAFWQTMAREWAGIDALRMDKFLYLVRCYVGKGFEVVGRGEWEDEESLEGYLGVLKEVPLNVRDAKIPNGLRFHVVDVYVDELEKVDTKRTAPVEKILAPLRRLGEDSLTKAVRMRVQEALEDERLRDWKGARTTDGVQSEDDGNEDEDEEFGGFGD